MIFRCFQQYKPPITATKHFIHEVCVYLKIDQQLSKSTSLN